MAKREKSATESLLQIAVVLELVVLFFGALAFDGLGLLPSTVVWPLAGLAMVLLLFLVRVLRYKTGIYVGHFFQLSLLASFVADIVIGLSFAVPVAFWIFGAIRGPMLDRNRPQPE